MVSLEHYIAWLRDLTLRQLKRKYLESFEMWRWRRMEKTKQSVKITNEVLEGIGEKRALLNKILHRKPNQIWHNLRINYLIHDAIEGQKTEVKGVGRRITQLLDLRNRKRYWGAYIITWIGT